MHRSAPAMLGRFSLVFEPGFSFSQVGLRSVCDIAFNVFDERLLSWLDAKALIHPQESSLRPNNQNRTDTLGRLPKVSV